MSHPYALEYLSSRMQLLLFKSINKMSSSSPKTIIGNLEKAQEGERLQTPKLPEYENDIEYDIDTSILAGNSTFSSTRHLQHENQSKLTLVTTALPEKPGRIEVTTPGATPWARIFKLQAFMPQTEEPKVYFLKISEGQLGRGMVEAEFESTLALRAVSQANVATPIAFGTLATDPESHFYLATFHCMEDRLRDMQELIEVVARIHGESALQKEKFGFNLPTYVGPLPVNNS